MFKTSRVIALVLVAVTFAFFPLARVAASENIANGEMISTEWITSGAKLEKWNWKTPEEQVLINLIEIDLQNPYIKLDAVIGNNGITGNKQTISAMAKETEAVAAVNGDFFTLNAEGAPFGITVKDGEMITSPGYIHAKNAFMIDTNGIPFIDRIDFDAKVIAADGSSFQLFGINKTQYSAGYNYAGNSHTNRLHMYTNNWNINNWVGKSLDNYRLVVIENDQVIKILENETVDIIPDNGYLLLGNGEAANFLKEHIHLGDPLKIDYSLNPNNPLLIAVDGSTLLVKDGEKAYIEYEIEGKHARTAVGYSKDKRYIYLVSVEKSKNSTGMTLNELSDFLLSRGIWKAVNFDGGGSTTMVSRPLGTYDLIDITTPQYGAERPVVNGLAVYSAAPAGKLFGWELFLAEGVLAGEEVPVKVNRAYDQFYNPVNPQNIQIDWIVPEGISYENGIFAFNQSGTYQLTAKAGELKETLKVKVYDKKDIAEIKIEQDKVRLHSGEEFIPTVTVKFSDGYERKVSNKLLDWSLVGVKGLLGEDGTLKATENSKGLLIAGYQGFSTSVPVDIGGSLSYRLIDSFENLGHYLVKGLTGQEKSNFNIELENGKSVGRFIYDFGNTDNVRIAYLQYGTLGKSVSGEPVELSLDVKGDNSNHWLRSEIRDAKGNIYYLDLAKKIDWSGWKSVNVPLPSNIFYPITIKSIYLVHLQDSIDQTETSGEVSFAEFKIRDWDSFEKAESPKLQFVINKKEVIAGSAKVVLDQEPVVINGRTFIPVRYVTELLGGQIKWVAAEKKVEIINNYQIFNFWLDKSYMNINGKKEELDQAPFIRNGRMMLPLRALSEGLGLYVHYDKTTKSIYIY